MAKFIRGTLKECVNHFAQRIKGKFQYRNGVCEFLGINLEVGHRWFDKLVKPEGLNLLKLLLFLEINGYDVAEFQNIHPKIREWRKFLALGVLEMDVAMKSLWIANSKSIFNIAFGKSGTTSEKMKEIEAECEDEELKKSAEAKLRQWKEKLVFKGDEEPQVEKPAPAATGAKAEVSVAGISHELALKMLAHQVKAMIPLAEWIASNQFTPEERRQLRELSANGRSNNVFELSTVLNRLCSETARKEMQ